MRFVSLAGILLVMAAAAQAPALAVERVPAEQWTDPYSASRANIPPCDNAGVLGRIQSRFAQTERTYWNSGLEIVEFRNVRPVGFRPWGLDFIPRLFCTGTVQVSDGRRHRIDYSVVEDGGIIGWGFGVEWCVVGFDRNLSFAPACKMAGP